MCVCVWKVIIPTNELHHFSEGFINHQPDNDDPRSVSAMAFAPPRFAMTHWASVCFPARAMRAVRRPLGSCFFGCFFFLWRIPPGIMGFMVI